MGTERQDCIVDWNNAGYIPTSFLSMFVDQIHYTVEFFFQGVQGGLGQIGKEGVRLTFVCNVLCLP